MKLSPFSPSLLTLIVISPAQWDSVVLPICLAVVLLIGWRSRRHWSTANEYLNASRSISTWVAALAFLAYNCGSIEVVGMSAMAAQYGVQALHFYWVGGIPGLVFMGLVVLPIYMRTGARSLPEYLGLRFGPSVRLLNAVISLIGTVCFSGVALYAAAQVLHAILGWHYEAGILLCAAVVLAYVLAGGVRASIFTSVFQLFVMIAGLAPLMFFTVHLDAAGWARRAARWRLWSPLPAISPHAQLDRFGVLLGLGFVISFSYWCTDFVMIQRALAARCIGEARKVPLLAGFGKMGIAFLVVLPGVASPALLPAGISFDQTMPALMRLEFGPALLALGAAALVAGLTAWLAGNVSGFSALWVEEIYRVRLRPRRSEQHYIRAGQLAVPVCLLLAQFAAFAAFRFRDMMEFLQLIVALFYAPVFAAVLAGLANRRATERGAFAGICAGVAAALVVQCCYWMGIARFGSQMSANFYEAALSFAIALGVSLLIRDQRPRHSSETGSSIFDAALWRELRPSAALVALSAALLAACLLLNVLWW
jgi:solute:Na+ symporter, SSS family